MEPLTLIKSTPSRTHLKSIFSAKPGSGKCNDLRKNLPSKLHNRSFTTVIRSFARRSPAKKLKRNGENGNQKSSRNSSDECNALADKPSLKEELTVEYNEVSINDTPTMENSISGPSRSDVLQACIVTSGVILAFGLLIRQVSHIAFTEGWPVNDCSIEVLFKCEMWHGELIIGLVILVSSCRYLLLRTWPDFAESSQAANQQVLSFLHPLDYVVVAFLPGISEELLFRGALLPLIGLNWNTALVVAAIFGILHLGSGRRFSFAIWATFVGLAYGYATVASSSIVVPMASHALNNLVGGIMWRYMRKTVEEK